MSKREPPFFGDEYGWHKHGGGVELEEGAMTWLELAECGHQIVFGGNSHLLSQ